jgi:hypothetical protein
MLPRPRGGLQGRREGGGGFRVSGFAVRLAVVSILSSSISTFVRRTVSSMGWTRSWVVLPTTTCSVTRASLPTTACSAVSLTSSVLSCRRSSDEPFATGRVRLRKMRAEVDRVGCTSVADNTSVGRQQDPLSASRGPELHRKEPVRQRRKGSRENEAKGG